MSNIDDTCSCGLCDDYSKRLFGALYEIADLRRLLDIERTLRTNAEAELAELKAPGKIASQLKAVRDVLGVSDTLSRPLHLYVADLLARAELADAATVQAKVIIGHLLDVLSNEDITENTPIAQEALISLGFACWTTFDPAKHEDIPNSHLFEKGDRIWLLTPDALVLIETAKRVSKLHCDLKGGAA